MGTEARDSGYPWFFDTMAQEHFRMRQNRVAKDLNPLLKRRLAVYALAGAAGLAASAPDANAAIVYTSLKYFGEGHIDMSSTISIDLNHDGVADFDVRGTVFSFTTISFGIFIRDIAVSGDVMGKNKIAITPANGYVASALTAGEEIGPDLLFKGSSGCALAHFVTSFPFPPRSIYGGFYNERNRFLGLNLVLNGSTYYGWARVNVRTVSSKTAPHQNLVFEVVDYAYQDIPDLPIRAGEGIPQADAALPAALGLLAYGSDAIPAWRSGQ